MSGVQIVLLKGLNFELSTVFNKHIIYPVTWTHNEYLILRKSSILVQLLLAFTKLVIYELFVIKIIVTKKKNWLDSESPQIN